MMFSRFLFTILAMITYLTELPNYLGKNDKIYYFKLQFLTMWGVILYFIHGILTAINHAYYKDTNKHLKFLCNIQRYCFEVCYIS